MQRKGMQLAVNTLVVLILGIVILGMGMALVYTIYDKSVAMAEEVPAQTEKRLFSVLLSSKQRIAVLNNVRDVERGDAVLFPVAIQNEIEQESEQFLIEMGDTVTATTKQGDSIDCADPSVTCPEPIVLPGPYEVERFKSKAFNVFVDVPKPTLPGEYTYRVKVYQGDTALSDDFNLYARTTVSVNIR